jgi:hypothetical protein
MDHQRKLARPRLFRPIRSIALDPSDFARRDLHRSRHIGPAERIARERLRRHEASSAGSEAMAASIRQNGPGILGSGLRQGVAR